MPEKEDDQSPTQLTNDLDIDQPEHPDGDSPDAAADNDLPNDVEAKPAQEETAGEEDPAPTEDPAETANNSQDANRTTSRPAEASEDPQNTAKPSSSSADPENTDRTKPPKKPWSKKRKVITICVIAAVILAIGTTILIILLNQPQPEPEPDNSIPDGIPRQELIDQHTGSGSSENELIPVDTEAIIVTELMSRFPVNNLSSPLGAAAKFYSEPVSSWSDRELIDLTLLATIYRGKKEACKFDATSEGALDRLKSRYEKMIADDNKNRYRYEWSEYRYLTFAEYYQRLPDDDKLIMLQSWYANDSRYHECYSRDTIEAISKKFFGRRANLKNAVDADNRLGSWGWYSPGYDEPYNISGRYGSSGAYYTRTRVKAEKDADHLYIYERVGIVEGGNLYKTSNRTQAIYYSNGNWSSLYRYIEDHPSELDLYKWTFTKSTNGNYVLSSIERQ